MLVSTLFYEQFELYGLQRYKVHVGIWAPWGVSMSDTATIKIDQPEEEILTYEVSDEVLESAAGNESEKAGNYSIAWCTFLTGCPI